MTDPIRTFRAGGWFGIFGRRATVLLPPAERDRVPDLWRLVDAGAGFDEALDALVAPGLRGLAACVLLGPEDGGLRVLVRGPARVRAEAGGGRIHLSGPTDATWVERRLTDVCALEVTLEEPAVDAPELTVGQGLVRLARMRQGTLVGPRSGDAPADRPDDLGDLDGATRGGRPTPAAAIPLPGIAGQPQPPGVVARAVSRLLLSTGESIDVDRPVVIGRAPEPRRLTPTDQPRLVAVASPQHEISSTHLEVRPGAGADHGTAVVTDLGSTNGTVVVQPALPPEDLRPGIAVQLLPGAIIDVGDGLTIQVVAP